MSICLIQVAATKPARVNNLISAPDASERLFAGVVRGQVYIIIDGTVQPEPFFDAHAFVGEVFVASGKQNGLSSYAFHPDYGLAGSAGFGRFYTVHSERAGEKMQDSGPIYRTIHDTVHHVTVISEWQVNLANPDRIDGGSQREILRIEQPFHDHNVGQINFNPTASPREFDYGMLYIGVGNGGDIAPRNGGGIGPFRQEQRGGSLYGKVLRIRPEMQFGLSYSVPNDNPFITKNGWLPEIWAYGFRNPQRFCWDFVTGQMYIVDIGQANIEEVNLGIKGANYGWSDFEGRYLVDREDQSRLFRSRLPLFLSALEFPIASYDHDEGAAISGGYVYRGKRINAMRGRYIFGDISNGRVFYFDTELAALSEQTQIQELFFIHQGRERTLQQIVGSSRVDLRFGQDNAGKFTCLAKLTARSGRFIL